MRLTYLAAALAAVILPLASYASPMPVYTTSVTIGYNPTALTSNFNNPGTQNNETAYTVRTGIDSTYFYVDVTANPPAGVTPDQFANIYIGGLNLNPGLIFEVENDRVSTTSNPSNYYYGLESTGYSSTTNPNDISFALPVSFFETDPLGIGFTKLTVGDEVRVSYSQSFGYSFVGGTANYGQARLGEQYIPAPAAVTPEPETLSLVGTGLMFCEFMRRRMRRA